MRFLCILPVLLTLTACGVVGGMTGPLVLEVSPTYAALALAGAPVLQVGVEAAGTATLARREGLRAGVATYVTPDGAAVILQDGMLRGTRGLGADLLASDIAAPRDLILSLREGTAARFHTFLDGENQAVTQRFVCAVAVQGAREIAIGAEPLGTVLVTEDCGDFVNYYWVLPTAARVVQSRQWGGAFSGVIVMREVAPCGRLPPSVIRRDCGPA